MARRQLDGARAIVTGASSGIGRGLALALAEAGAKVVLMARREARLRELAEQIAAGGGAAEIVVGDVTEAAARQAALGRAAERFGGLDLLVNNAGVGAIGLFAEASPERLRRLMEVNFFALVEMTREALPLLRRGRRPMIVNVGSVLGHRAVGHCAEYCASKFAVRGFSEALRVELAGEGVDVLLVSPGTTETEFGDNVLERKGTPGWSGRMRYVSVESVARQTLRAIRRGSREVIPYPGARLLVVLNALVPSVVDWFVARWR